MATVIKSIGTNGRDYSTVALWEADLDNAAVYASGDDAIGEMYADSDFDTIGTLNGGSALNSRTLGAASGHEHGGIAGSGVRVLRSSTATTLLVTSQAYSVADIEIDYNGYGTTDYGVQLNTGTSYLFRFLIHGMVHSQSTSAHRYVVEQSSGQTRIYNTVIYDCEYINGSSGGFYGISDGTSSAIQIQNCTIHDLRRTDGSGNVFGIVASGTSNQVYNNVVTGLSGTSSGAKTCFSGSSSVNETNASEDNTAATAFGGTDPAPLTGLNPSDIYVSTVRGAEDLSPKAGSALIDAGTARTGSIGIDIRLRDRITEGDTWDIGAYEYVATGGTATIVAGLGEVISVDLAPGRQGAASRSTIMGSLRSSVYVLTATRSSAALRPASLGQLYHFNLAGDSPVSTVGAAARIAVLGTLTPVGMAVSRSGSAYRAATLGSLLDVDIAASRVGTISRPASLGELSGSGLSALRAAMAIRSTALGSVVDVDLMANTGQPVASVIAALGVLSLVGFPASVYASAVRQTSLGASTSASLSSLPHGLATRPTSLGNLSDTDLAAIITGQAFRSTSLGSLTGLDLDPLSGGGNLVHAALGELLLIDLPASVLASAVRTADLGLVAADSLSGSISGSATRMADLGALEQSDLAALRLGSAVVAADELGLLVVVDLSVLGGLREPIAYVSRLATSGPLRHNVAGASPIARVAGSVGSVRVIVLEG